MLTKKKRIAFAMFALLASAGVGASEAPGGVVKPARNDVANVAS